MPDYQKLKTMVKRCIDQKFRLWNFDARNEKIETGAVVTSRRGFCGVEEDKEFAVSGKQRAVIKGDQCSFRHDEDKRAKPTPKPHHLWTTNTKRQKCIEGKEPQRPESIWADRDKGLFLSVYVDDIKLAGKKQDIDPLWKVLMKEVDMGEPTSFFDHVYSGCT